jgi:hypothetical protein
LADLTAQRDLPLAQSEAGKPQDSFDLLHGQPLLRQPGSSTFRVKPGPRWIAQRRQARVASGPLYPTGRVIGIGLER